MKMRKYENIKPSNRTNFVMVYYHASRTLTQIETLLKKAATDKTARPLEPPAIQT